MGEGGGVKNPEKLPILFMDGPYLSIYLATLVFNSVYISTMNGEYDLLVEFNYFPGVHSAGEQRRCSFLASLLRPSHCVLNGVLRGHFLGIKM